MALALADSWTWDFWLADDGAHYHLFFLRASRALLDPDRRHHRASVGHAVSRDLRSWTLLPDALVAADPPAPDDLATWTGSVLRDPRGGWRMFYTGVDRAGAGLVQRILWADSPDLLVWTRRPGVLTADPRWYETRPAAAWPDEAWRDPWVFADPGGDGWHMLITARSPTGDPLGRGVVGHARSVDLDRWTAQPPLSAPGAGFGQLEVMQLAVVEGRAVLVFSCLAEQMAPGRREPAGVWALPLDSPTGPFDLTRATPLTGPELYAGRLTQDRTGAWMLLAFVHDGPDGFVGGLSDPIPVGWRDGRLQTLSPPP